MGASLSYHYTKKGDPVTLRVPAQEGDYEIRYVLGQPPRVLASIPLKTAAEQASLEAPQTVAAGSRFNVAWQGPGANNDWITIVKPEAKDRSYKSYAYARQPNIELTAALEPGNYEIRYVMAGKEVLARRPIVVTDVTATIAGPAQAQAGETITVGWTGPAERGDWITIVAPDASDKSFTSYFYPQRTLQAVR